MSRAAEALHKSCVFQCFFERFTCVLASSVAVKDYSFQLLLAISQFKFLYGSDAQFLLHIVLHCHGKNFSVEAIKCYRYIQLAVNTLYLCDIGKQLLKWSFRCKVAFDQVFTVLYLSCSLGNAAGRPSMV